MKIPTTILEKHSWGYFIRDGRCNVALRGGPIALQLELEALARSKKRKGKVGRKKQPKQPEVIKHNKGAKK